MKFHLSHILFFVVLLLSPLSLFAHPHSYIFANCTLEFEEGKAKGLWVEFEFDSLFSGEVNFGFDQNRDGIFNERETAELEEYVFSSFKDFNYFTFIRMGKERYLPENVKHFSARQEGFESLIFRFFVPLEDFPHRDFHIALYDSSFFCSCRLNEEVPDNRVTEDFFRTTGTGIPDITVTVGKNKEFPVYYNPESPPTDLTTYSEWEPGLATYIPEEIHVQF
ncbi:MAG: DUF1007 family protein [Spirochaetales bacterium]|nr:DUF1007 family protein [Spirochaetales bacterium]